MHKHQKLDVTDEPINRLRDGLSKLVITRDVEAIDRFQFGGWDSGSGSGGSGMKIDRFHIPSYNSIIESRARDLKRTTGRTSSLGGGKMCDRQKIDFLMLRTSKNEAEDQKVISKVRGKDLWLWTIKRGILRHKKFTEKHLKMR